METQKISTVLEMLRYGVRSMCILTNITILITEDPESYRCHQFSNIQMAIVDAIEKGRLAVLNLELAILPSIVELNHLCKLVDDLAMKKEESTFTSWICKPYHHRSEACVKLCESIDCDKIKLVANDVQLLEGFADTIAACENIIDLCKKPSKCRGTARLLRAACGVVVAILTCARARVLALQVGGMVTAQARSRGGGHWADGLLKKFKNACKRKRKSLIGSTQANKELMERTEREARELEADILAAKNSKFESVETALSKLCELVTQARNTTHTLSEFLQYCKAHDSHLKLQRLRDSCDDFVGRSRTAYNALVKYEV